MPGTLEYLSWPMIELRGVHRSNERDVVHDLGHVRQKLGKPHAGLPILFERERGLLELWSACDERETLTVEKAFRNRFLISFYQRGFVVEQINVGYATDLLQVDDVLRLGRKVKWMSA